MYIKLFYIHVVVWMMIINGVLVDRDIVRLS